MRWLTVVSELMLRRLKEVLLVVHGSKGDWVLTPSLPPPGSHQAEGRVGCAHGSCWPAKWLLGQKTEENFLVPSASRESSMRGNVSFHSPA